MRWPWIGGILVGGALGVALALGFFSAEPAEDPETEILAEPVAGGSPFPGWAALGIPPQDGLVPLGPDPVSGLMEFGVADSGRVPDRQPDRRLAIGPDTAVVLVLLPEGTFLRGAQPEFDRPGYDEDATDFEGPVAEVTVPAFFIGKYETTAAQWACLAREGAPGVTPTLPVVDVSWAEARERLASAGLRLPAEAEWEYACRAGSTASYWSGDLKEDLSEIAWTLENSAVGSAFVGEAGGAIHVVGGLAANAFGLHDVHGNVSEWVEDRWHASYRGAPLDGAAWTAGATLGRVVRGGSWYHGVEAARSAARRAESPDRTLPWIGVRIARSVESRGR